MRIGIDLGGTKIEAALLGADGQVVHRTRMATPRGAYAPIVAAIAALVRQAGPADASVGVGIPGSLDAREGRVRNANTTELNGHKLAEDLTQAIGRPVRVSNDANCLAAAEAGPGGAAPGLGVVFAVILGTGCGGGIAINGQVHEGRNRVAGEWGHTPLPWPGAHEYPGHTCWCGRQNCLETWLAGPGLAADAGLPTGAEVLARATAGDAHAQAALDRHAERLARALANIINILDPDAIVLGGGLSNMAHLYDQVPRLWQRFVLSDQCDTPLLRATQGDSAGVIGAARLWP